MPLGIRMQVRTGSQYVKFRVKILFVVAQKMTSSLGLRGYFLTQQFAPKYKTWGTEQSLLRVSIFGHVRIGSEPE